MRTLGSHYLTALPECYGPAYKWKQTRWWVMLDLAIYVVSLVIASFATVRLAWEASNPWEQTLSFPHGKATTEMIVLVMIVLELLLFVWECTQMVRANLLMLTLGQSF